VPAERLGTKHVMVGRPSDPWVWESSFSWTTWHATLNSLRGIWAARFEGKRRMSQSWNRMMMGRETMQSLINKSLIGDSSKTKTKTKTEC